LRKRIPPVLLLVFVLSLWISVPASGAESPAPGPDTIKEILNYVQTEHISSPDPGTLTRGAIEGLIDTLDDPYTEYLPGEELEEFNRSLDGDYVGVGIQLEPGEVYPVVVNTIENAPARDAGVKPGDLLIKVEGVDVAGEPLGKVVQRIRGLEGTTVRLTLRRQGAGDFEIGLDRANINMPTVSGLFLDGGTGYIGISSFGAYTAGEFREVLAGQIRRGADKLILDLRDNPGGLLQGAVQIISCFVEPGKLAVSVAYRGGDRQEYHTDGAPIARNMPVVILVNRNSASAAEILTGALQDYGAAVLAGERTYGKGTVQAVIPLKAGGALKLTIARYHTPKDRVIDGTGLDPDIQVLTPDLQLAAAERYLEQPEKNTITVKTGKSEALVNGKTVFLRQGAIQRSGVTYLPLRFVLEALGYRVDWQAQEGSIKIIGYNTMAAINPEGGSISVGGRPVPGGEPLLFEDGAAYISISTLSLLNIGVKIEDGKITIEK